MRTTKLNVSISNFFNNVSLIENKCKKELIPIFKAHAYGTYLDTQLEVLNHFKIIGVALVEEGVEIRKNGFLGDILVLNQPAISDIGDIMKYHLTIGLSDLSFLEECIKIHADFSIHLEIETGMNRTGVSYDKLGCFLDALEKSNLKVDGIYSHFSSADFDPNYSKMQIDRFQKAVQYCMSRGLHFTYIHLGASSGILNYSIPFTNAVRPGILLYGYEAFPGACKILPVKPICKLTSSITFLKEVDEGEKIGYGQTYTCPSKCCVATIPIGYGDGYRRSLSNRGYVLVSGQKAPILGNVCMDSIMVDVSGIHCTVGDEVILFDEENLLLDNLAQMCNTINYEILCTISERVPRVFQGGENE